MASITIDNRVWEAAEFQELISLLRNSPDEWKKSIADFLAAWLSADDAITVKTSGSTGDPKLIQLPKSLMQRSAEITAENFSLPAKSSAMMCLGANYIAGKMMIVRTLVNDWRLTIVEPMSTPFEGLNEPFDFCAMVPLQVEKTLVRHPDLLASTGHLIVGGAAISHSQIDKLIEAKVRASATYGMTETATHVAVRELSPSPQASFTLLPDFQATRDSRGCLVISASHLPVDIVTNDVVQLDERMFVLRGRFDNVINSGGIKVFPEEIEKKLEGVTGGRRYYVTSQADSTLGERVTLVVEGEGKSVDPDLLAKCASLLSQYQAPRDVIFEAKFSETSSGKVIRKKF